MNINEKYTVEIESIAAGGEGIARIKGLTCFVERSVPGDKLEIKTTQVRNSYVKGEIMRILEPSSDRIIPRCEYFDDCGACQLQHISYSSQLKIKKQIVIDALKMIGGVGSPIVKDVIGMQDPWGYRNKVQYPVRRNTKHETRNPKIGYYKKGTHEVVDIEDCPVLHPFLNKIASAARNAVMNNHIAPYDEDIGKGVLRHILAKVGFVSKMALLTFVINSKEFAGSKNMVRDITQGIEDDQFRLVSCSSNINTRQSNVILGERTINIWGRDHISDSLGKYKFDISPVSFFQINPVQTVKLYDVVKHACAFTGNEKVVDAFCGIGTISLWISDKAKEVYGIEENPSAIDNANNNARANSVRNVFFKCGSVEKILKQFTDTGFCPDILILDPPRVGCSEEVIRSILHMFPKRIVYVSCDPATFARDIKNLSAKYQLTSVQPVDMFPHTAHIECVGVLENR